MVERIKRKIEEIKDDIAYYESEIARSKAKIEILNEIIEEEKAEEEELYIGEQTITEETVTPNAYI